MKEVTSDPQTTPKTQIHSNNYPCQGEMKLDTIKEKKKINCVMCSSRKIIIIKY